MNLYILITKRIRIGAFKALSCNGNEMPTIKVLFKSFSIFPGKKKKKNKERAPSRRKKYSGDEICRSYEFHT